MHSLARGSTPRVLGKAALSGIAGTVVMTAFQKLVEMPITQRGTSYAPADFAEKALPIHPKTARGRWLLNYGTHFALGGMWGAAYGVAALNGLRGQKAVHTVFGVVNIGDVLLNTALGVYRPSRWSAKDVGVDLLDKYVQAQATALVFERVLDCGGGPSSARERR